MQYIIDTRDIQAVGNEFSLSSAQVGDMIDFVIKELTATVAETWQKIAQQSLHRTRSQYIKGLYVGDEGKYTGFVQLRGILPNMLESGCDPFDMKPGFLNPSNPKVHEKKGGGYYFTVPLRWGVPSSSGESEGFAGIMPTAVYNIVKNKLPAITGLGGTALTGQPIKLRDLPAEYRVPASRAPIITKSAKYFIYHHKTAMMAGLVRAEKTYESANQGQYVTFRRISSGKNGSDPLSWIHRGFQAKMLAEKALDGTDVTLEVNRKTDVFLQQLGF